MSHSSTLFARRMVAGYLIVQACGTLLWWLCLITWPGTIAWFQPPTWPNASLLSFWPPDLCLIVIGSLASAWAVLRQKPWASMSLWMIAGAAWYATLYCVGCSVATDQAWIATSMMACMSGLTLAMATIHGQPQQVPATFRTTPMHPIEALVWSHLQLIIFWSVFLWILPKGLLEFQRQALLIEPFEHAAQSFLSITLFAIASAVGLSSCWAIAWRGEGTPLPTANAPKLVIAGPYRLVRNPMALAGIFQGAASGWLLGSWLVIAYAILGAFTWHFIVRPLEEAEMSKRFGTPYRHYQSTVRLWLPIPRHSAHV